MRWICLSLAMLVVMSFPVYAGSKPPMVTLRVHVQTTGEGLSPQEASTIPVPPNGEQVQVRTMPEASERDLVDVREDAAGLHLQFNHIGTVALSVSTAQNQGRLMVVFVDGRVIYAPVIDTQITNGHLDIPHQIPPEIVQLLQQLAQKNVRDAERT